jgi:hypothetical protein
MRAIRAADERTSTRDEVGAILDAMVLGHGNADGVTLA